MRWLLFGYIHFVRKLYYFNGFKCTNRLCVGNFLCCNTYFYRKNALKFFAQGMFTTVDSYFLMAVPLFVFCGLIMELGGLSRRLIDVAKLFVGHFSEI